MTRIALAQTNSTDDFDHNLSVALKLVQEAAAAGAALLAFPEVFLLIGSKQKKLEHALTLDDPIVLRFQELAVRHGIFILLGSVHERIAGNAERVHNTSVLLDDRGLLTESRGSNLFVVRGGTLYTPRSGILEGITRQTVFEIAAELGIPAAEHDLSPYDLYTAEEAFLCSTAGGIYPIAEADGRSVGSGGTGPITRALRDRYWERHLSGPDVTPVFS